MVLVPQWLRPGTPRSLGNHEARIRALERQAGSGGVYIDDRILDAPAMPVLFDTFPSNLHILELTWEIQLDQATASDADSLLFANFGDSFAAPVVDYFWRLAGTVALDDGDGSDAGGGLGLLALGKLGWGRVRFPDYSAPVPDVAFEEGPTWLGDGAIAHTGGGAETEQWIAAGYRQGSDPMTSIELNCYSLDGLDHQTFSAGSRFTLAGY